MLPTVPLQLMGIAGDTDNAAAGSVGQHVECRTLCKPLHVSDDFVATDGLLRILKKTPSNLITACESVDSKLWVTPAFLEQ
jgi:hypothetical protein